MGRLGQGPLFGCRCPARRGSRAAGVGRRGWGRGVRRGRWRPGPYEARAAAEFARVPEPGVRLGITDVRPSEELGVSTRTLHRDLALLRETGVPVEATGGPAAGCASHPAGLSAGSTSTSPRRSARFSASPSPRRPVPHCSWTTRARSPARSQRRPRRRGHAGSSRCAGGS
ncbi:helix-turn-helix domain-containing protein [Streptomyces sp. NPDC047706]|uniref:helix-turn-helix domain-containing protein n=1 Tax=Streptomyces sp. NPDC047706 TaxID=3365486 RepID=UPI0037100542